MSVNGYIYLDRKVMDNWVYKEKPFNKGMAWIDLLLLAEHTTHMDLWRGKPKEYKRGTVNRSIKWLCERWGWSRDKGRRFLRQLENNNMITINATTHDTTITIVNYDVFQNKRTTDKATDKTTHKATNKATDKATDKTYQSNISNAKENKEIKKEDPVPPGGGPDPDPWAWGGPKPSRWNEDDEWSWQNDQSNPNNPRMTRMEIWKFWGESDE